jgi:hypothetical protein
MYITRMCGLWSDENPHAIHSARHQQQFSVSVWASIVGDNLIGPHIFPNLGWASTRKPRLGHFLGLDTQITILNWGLL